MKKTFTLKRHDLGSPIDVVLGQETTPGNYVPIDLTNATSVLFTMRKQSDPTPTGVVVDKAACSVISAAGGQVRYSFASGETDTSGAYDGEIKVMWGTSPETFPPDGYIRIVILDDLA